MLPRRHPRTGHEDGPLQGRRGSLRTLLMLSVWTGAVGAPGTSIASIPGGGSAKTACFAEFAGVTLNAPPPPRTPRLVQCRDGDPCDADGIANNVCTFDLAVCLNNTDPRLPGCTPPPDGIAAYAVKNPPLVSPKRDPDLAALEHAVQAELPTKAHVCTPPVPVRVPVIGPDATGTFAAATKIVRATATTPSRRNDATHLTLVCLPNPAAHADWPTYGFDLSRNRFNPREGVIGRRSASRLAVRWFFSTGTGTAAVSASPSVVNGVVYVGSWNGTMYALDAYTGGPSWTFDIHDPHPDDRVFPGIQSSAAVADGRVYFGAADANVYALEAATGHLVWKVSLGNPDTQVEGAHGWSSPAVFHGRVYVGKASHLDAPCVRGAVVALDAATGNEVWRFNTLPDNLCSNDPQKPCATDADCTGGTCQPFLVCRADTGQQAQILLCSSDADCAAPATCQRPLGGGVTSSAAIDEANGVVYVSTGDCVGFGEAGFANSLLALDAETGTLRWAFRALPPGDLRDFDFIASPNIFQATDGVSTERLVGAGNKDGVYYALDQDTGSLVWQKLVTPGTPNLFGGFNASTGAAFGNIFAGTFSGPPFIFALKAFDGSVAWQCPSGECTRFSFGPPGIGDGVVVLGDSGGILRAFDAATGGLLRSLDLGGAISSGPAVVNGMVIVGAGTGGFGTAQKQGVYGLAVQ